MIAKPPEGTNKLGLSPARSNRKDALKKEEKKKTIEELPEDLYPKYQLEVEAEGEEEEEAVEAV